MLLLYSNCYTEFSNLYFVPIKIDLKVCLHNYINDMLFKTTLKRVEIMILQFFILNLHF